MTILQYLRHERRLSAAQVGAMSGVHQPVVNLIETLRLRPKPEELAGLGRALNVDPPETLLEEIQLTDAQRAALREEVTA